MTTMNVPNYVPVQYRQAVVNASAKWNVPADLIAAVIMTESGWNPQAGDNVDSYNSYGLGQFIPSTAKSLGVNTHDAGSSIDGVGHLLHDNYQATGNWDDAVAAYNTGLGGIVGGKPTGNGLHYIQVVKSYLSGAMSSLSPTSSSSSSSSSSDATLTAATSSAPGGATAQTAGFLSSLNPLSGVANAITDAVSRILDYGLDSAMIGAGLVALFGGMYLVFKGVR